MLAIAPTYRRPLPVRPVKGLFRPQATAEAVQTQATGHGIVHFSGHASYDWHDTSQSALACLDKPLSLATIRREMNVRAACLVTLSACETGISDVFLSLRRRVHRAAHRLARSRRTRRRGQPMAALHQQSRLVAPHCGVTFITQSAKRRAKAAPTRHRRAKRPRMSMLTALNTASKPDERPFAHPFYWAAFAAYGAVL